MGKEEEPSPTRQRVETDNKEIPARQSEQGKKHILKLKNKNKEVIHKEAQCSCSGRVAARLRRSGPPHRRRTPPPNCCHRRRSAAWGAPPPAQRNVQEMAVTEKCCQRECKSVPHHLSGLPCGRETISHHPHGDMNEPYTSSACASAQKKMHNLPFAHNIKKFRRRCTTHMFPDLVLLCKMQSFSGAHVLTNTLCSSIYVWQCICKDLQFTPWTMW
ncbi:uncharacterized protein LOC128351248 [Hemicordylus capensis]|uniref:uncharacterized protein LOC128351248 n=1 Tax=Hemicordylus capensis TaxID=884348 RepID=UPI0023037009|nr:uncharacterized protein LOC128351248 [Hemicordylus capensis]